MALSQEVVSEIIFRPHRLKIVISRGENSDKYLVTIFLKQGRGFKRLLSTNACAKTQVEAVAVAETVFEIIFRVWQDNFGHRQKLDPVAEILTPELVEWILAELRAKQEADTANLPLAS